MRIHTQDDEPSAKKPPSNKKGGKDGKHMSSPNGAESDYSGKGSEGSSEGEWELGDGEDGELLYK